MKQLKKLIKRIIIVYLIFYISIASTTSSLARGYDKQCGEYASTWAKTFIEKYASQSQYDCDGALGSINGKSACRWSGGKEGSGTFYGCCTCWVHWIYYYSLGVDINDMGFDPWSDTAYANLKGGNEYFDDVSSETLQPGDILIVKGHAEMYAGDGQHVNFGSTPMNIHGACSRMTPGRSSEGAIAVRLKSSVDVNPAGTVPVGDVDEENLSIYDENGFIYSGVAKISAYEGSQPFGKWIFKMLGEILDYLIGILTLGVRVVIVGWTAIIERGIIDGIVNSVTGVTEERVDGWEKDPNSVDEIDNEVSNEVENTTTQTPAQAAAEADYTTSEGMEAIADIGGKVQLNTTSEANVTVENIVYNKIPILDVNFFNFESAGGAVVDENGIIYIIKTNVAMWYYAFRVLAITIMLLVLLYLGIKMVFTVAAEKKAVYKQMLLSWLVGFILIFAMNYIMYAVISINETFIEWIIPKYEDGSEISLYETVRSKAYEIKASSGFAGMIMYIILVYYAIRFLFVYFKRFFTVTILALMSPFIGVSYALEKINKKGKGEGEIYGNWFKDFTYTVILQSMHALIYTIFIQTVLDLTETSIIGIFIAFMFLHFMVKVDPILRKIFGFTGGKNTAKLSIDDLMPKIALAKGLGKTTKKVTGAYGNFLGRTIGAPLGNVAAKASNKINQIGQGLRENIEVQMTEEERDLKRKEQEEKKKKAEERKKKLNQIEEGVAAGISIGGNTLKALLAGAATLPIMIVEPGLGIELLSATVSSREKVKKSLENLQKKKILPKPVSTPKSMRFKLKGIKPRNKASAQRLVSRLAALGIGYDVMESLDATNKGNSTSKPTKARRTNGKMKLSPEERKELLTKRNINNLRFAKSGKNIESILDSGDPNSVESAVAYAEILAKARETEREIEHQYRQLTGKIDDQIAAMEKISPEFAKSLQDKKEKELIRTTKILTEPLSEKDIYRAMQNYKSKVPMFNMDSEYLSQRDIEGITKEIDSVLENKGENIQMSKEFMNKVQKEVTESQRRRKEEQSRNDETQTPAGVVGKDVTQKAEYKSLKERVKELNVVDRNNPYAEGNRNAPKANSVGGRSSVDDLVKKIQNASKGTDSKTSSTMSRTNIQFASNLDELKKLSKEASELIGEELYDIKEVLERLKRL